MNEITLKLKNYKIHTETPWVGDAFGDREKIADALTNLLKDEINPISISLNGGWGTGKTFLLKRWQQNLKNKGKEAIYFNAWEDDFCGDPLVAIIGQLWNSLKDSDYKEMVNTVKETAKPLLIKSILKIAGTAIQTDLTETNLKSTAEKTVDEYFNQGAKKKELKKRLTEMAKEVAKKTGSPLFFIIDELDRCRPTFSIELLERVKHIFDIPNIVFIFGIDREQLGHSIKSVYGDIDVDGYLHRFFDMDFSLPPANSATFCEMLMDKHNLEKYFLRLASKSNDSVHFNEYNSFYFDFSKLCLTMDLTLRDIEHCIRTFIFVAKNLEKECFMFTEVLSIFILLRHKNKQLYIDFINGKSTSSDIINYFNLKVYEDDFENDHLIISIYLCEYIRNKKDLAKEQLKLLAEGKQLTMPKYLSSQIKELTIERIKDFYSHYETTQNKIEFNSGDVMTKASFQTSIVERLELAGMMIKENY